MAADFMERQVLFRSNFIFLLTITFCCKPAKHTDIVFVSADDPQLAMRNGVVFYDQNTFTGKIFELYPLTCDTMSIQSYFEGKEDGVWKKFFDNGKLSEQRFYKNGIKTSRLTRWWPNGTTMLTYTFENGEYEGTCREWNAFGGLIKEMNYSKGHEAGTQKMFYDNGKVRSNYVVIDGRRFGLLGTKNCVNAVDSIPTLIE